MDSKDKLIEELQFKIEKLESKVSYLRGLLDDAKIPYKEHYAELSNINTENQGDRIIPEHITPEHAKYFYSIFKGRMDVYSKRAGKPNPKTGKTGIIRSVGIFGKMEFVPKRMARKSNVVNVKTGNINN